MTSGNISKFEDIRESGQSYAIATYSLEVVVAAGTAEKIEYIDLNGDLGFLGIRVPSLTTTDKKADITIRDNESFVVYSTGNVSCNVSAQYSVHLHRYVSLRNAVVVTTDENVTADAPFIIKFRLN